MTTLVIADPLLLTELDTSCAHTLNQFDRVVVPDVVVIVREIHKYLLAAVAVPVEIRPTRFALAMEHSPSIDFCRYAAIDLAWQLGRDEVMVVPDDWIDMPAFAPVSPHQLVARSSFLAGV